MFADKKSIGIFNSKVVLNRRRLKLRSTQGEKERERGRERVRGRGRGKGRKRERGRGRERAFTNDIIYYITKTYSCSFREVSKYEDFLV